MKPNNVAQWQGDDKPDKVSQRKGNTGMGKAKCWPRSESLRFATAM